MARTVKVPEAFLPLFEAAERRVAAYFARKEERHEKGQIDIDGERYILVRAMSLSVEFYDMMKALYGEREDEALAVTKNLLFHLSHFIGRSDARAFHRKTDLQDPVEKLSDGPVHFAHAGWAFVDISPESRMTADDGYCLVYDHPYSFESAGWIKAERIAPFPICFMNAGYSSGWCEESFGIPLVATEILCTAKGDSCCRFIMAPPSKIEQRVREYLDAHPDLAGGVTVYEVPGEFMRKEIEDRLRVSEFRYELLFENAFDAIVLLEKGRIDHVNRRAVSMFGLSRTEMRGRPFPDLAPPRQHDGRPSREVFQAYRRRAEQGAPQLFRWLGETADGSPLETEVSLNKVEGRPGSLMAILRDQSERVRAEKERRRLEREVRQLQKMEALGTLAGGVAHDFNNILAGLQGFIEVLQEHLPRDAPPLQLASEASALVDRASALVKQLLNFARTSQNVTEPIDLNRVVRDNMVLLRETIDRRIALETALEKEPVPVEGDANQLSQAILNLVLNAKDSLLDRLRGKQGGFPLGEAPAIRIVTSSVPATEAEASGAQGDLVSLSVEDNGTGMDAGTRERALEPFFTTKEGEQGTGLGLSMVFGIVQLHKGSVDIESEPGKGARVSLLLPRGTDAAPGPSPPPTRERLGGDETILYIEDEELLRRVMVQWLEKLGYTVLAASDGLAGIETFERGEGTIDAVVLDNKMPGLSGREVLERIRARSPETPVILTSGYFTDLDPEDLVARGASDVLPKPYEPSELSRRLRALLDRDA